MRQGAALSGAVIAVLGLVAACGGSSASGTYAKQAGAVCQQAQKAQRSQATSVTTPSATISEARKKLTSALALRAQIANSYLPKLEAIHAPANQGAEVSAALSATQAQIGVINNAVSALQHNAPITQVSTTLNQRLVAANAAANRAWKKLGVTGCEGGG